MTTNTTTGGFVGDPSEAFTPPATTGCCGGVVTPAADNAASGPTGCCGSAEATAAGQCCTQTAREEAIQAGAGCCG